MRERLGALAIIVACATVTARADAYTPDVTVLVRALVAEAGAIRIADHAAILWTLDRRANRRREPLAQTARSYCQIFRGPAGWWGESIVRAPLIELAEMAPSVVALVLDWQRGERPRDPCDGATHFGQAHGRDLARAQRAGWRRVACREPMAMAYWVEARR